jgi:large subunit ribosomal protein L24
MAAKLKKGDKVVVLAGKDKGKEGEIVSVDPKAGKAVVDGINIAIRHTKQSQNSQGGRMPQAMPIDLSNLALIDKNGKADPRRLPHGRRQEGPLRQDHGGRDRCLIRQTTPRA